MPNMCWSVPRYSDFRVDYNYWDWKVIFNRNVFGEYNVLPATINDKTTRDATLCTQSVTASSNIPSDNLFTLTSGYADIQQAVGISIKN